MVEDPKCIECGESFFLSTANRKFCSPLCRERNFHKERQAKRRLTPLFVFPCPVCGKEVATNNARKKYCSPSCNFTVQNAKRETTKQEIRKCRLCEKEFQPNQKRGVGSSFCSKQCKNKHNYTTYAERRHKSRWHQRKFVKWGGNWWAALKRDKFTCQICSRRYTPAQWHGPKTSMMVHHLDGSGESEAKNHDLSNLQTVCKACHKLYHQQVHLVFVDGKPYVTGPVFGILGIESVGILTIRN